MAHIVELTSLDCRYGKHDVFRNYSARWSNKTVIVGSNGSGKTTMLRLIAREIIPESGDILVDGRRDYRAMTLFDDGILFDHLSVASHFAWLCDVYKKDASWSDLIRASFGLASYWPLHPNDLSSGQRRWCALALAMSVQADIYLFDEPLNVLDAEHKALWFSMTGIFPKTLIVTDQSQNRDQWDSRWDCAVLP